MTRARVRRLGAAALTLAATACTPPPPTWQRADVGAETTRAVELDCHQRSITAIAAATGPADVERVHQAREQFVARCMRASGFERR